MLSKNEIRILHLLPSEPSRCGKGDLECKTEVIPLSASVDYETLSYVWGDQRHTTQITVDGKQVTITKTLESALKRLQLRDKSRCIWIDQLCINQKDNNEKANQVPLMRHIYSHTTQCIVWLGEIKPGTALSDAESALDILRFMCDYGKQDLKPQPPKCLGYGDALRASVQALDSICLGNNPWWQRVWTLQEAVLPSKSCILWGHLSIPWDVLVAAGLSYPVPPVDDIIEPYRDIVDKLFTQTTGLDLAKKGNHGPLDVIFRWSFRQATNPRDKVYGLLGLLPAGTLPRVEKCDYDLSPASVFAMATADLIEHYRSLHPLALRCLRNLPESTPDIPGWALDMGISRYPSIGTVDGEDAAWCMMHNYYPFDACGPTSVDWTEFQFDRTQGSLTLTGYKVDTIALACPALTPQSNAAGNRDIVYSDIINTVNTWQTMVTTFSKTLPRPQNSNEEDYWSDSFWRTLLGGLKLDPEYIPEGAVMSADIAMVKDFIQTGVKNLSCYSLSATMCHRTMHVTERGLLGVGPPHLDVGDEVWILDGGRVPFILRPVANGPMDHLGCIGASYVDGIMNGESVERSSTSDRIVLF
ncbi:hypothetical protein F66182_4166 [Fusarium sp. NRRL 66182]|nr:hypothetical protein F66182_4166 [Fusarium sp. NRRL 66182]